MDKSPAFQRADLEKKKAEANKQISQLQNKQKILLNRKHQEERRARAHRLIERGAILEAVFPPVADMEGEKVKTFLIGLSRLPGTLEAMENAWKIRDGEET